MQGLLLLDVGLKICGIHLYTKHFNYSHHLKMANLNLFKYAPEHGVIGYARIVNIDLQNILCINSF